MRLPFSAPGPALASVPLLFDDFTLSGAVSKRRICRDILQDCALPADTQQVGLACIALGAWRGIPGRLGWRLCVVEIA